MKFRPSLVLLAVGLLALPAPAAPILFDFNTAAQHAPLPLNLTQGGVTAYFSATGQGFSIQDPNSALGFVPVGFSGLCIYPDSVFPADLLVSFSTTLTDLSIMYAPVEYATDSSATMRLTAYLGAAPVGTTTYSNPNAGTYPVGTLSFGAPTGFDRVVVHYDAPPVTGGDYAPVFLADNMTITPVGTPPVGAPDATSTAGMLALALAGLSACRRWLSALA